MKKMTIRVDDYIYDRINLIAKKSKTSANKIIAKLVKDNINENSDIDYVNSLNKKLDYLIRNIENINKRQVLHFRLSKQHFANVGYLSNADINEDETLKEIFSNKFHD